METVLKLKKIRKTFNGLVANDDIDLEVSKGTVHTLIGENGAGKSTLMKILDGIYIPDSGEIYVKGKKVSFCNPNDACAHGIGMVHQEFMLFPEMTVIENIMMGSERTKAGIFLNTKLAREEIEKLCKDYNFPLPLDETVENLAVAMQQQVEIVKVLYRGADVIIMDEPTSVLTPLGIEGLFNAIRFLVSTGKTIIFISHKLKEVLDISDHITVLRDGVVTGNVKPENTTQRELASLMVGRDVILTAQKLEKDTGENILEVKNLVVKDRNGHTRIKNIDLNVRAGEIVGIAGVAGSGQRELVEALYGLANISDGKISFEKRDITRLSCRQRRCLGIGYVPQDRLQSGVNINSTVWENSIIGYHVAHGFKNKLFLNLKQAKDFSRSIIKEYNVKTPGPDAKVRTLSGGNIQKLIVGREFMQNNKLLIIEDPTRGIDIGAIEFIWKKIIYLASTGVGVLLVSHELNEVMELSDRIEVIYDGTLTPAGPKEKITEHSISYLMTGGNSNDALA